ncbi:hypothetical protein L1D59_19395 [Pseudoalteromonas piscicida]|uniref:hypothetical protein n=1 Tax=Pseudoalteromonas piscicida TaxID=43662 RepID=UPI001EFEA7F1|nr:hypothetical protein [Pseudoalteromonas piscicida]MCG9770767.1 hypothetical protein [Pseudoalteromonas piscicida]
MAVAYIQSIDITENGRVQVSGQLSSTNLNVSLNEMIPVVPPADGIWNYELTVTPTSMIGADMLVPFVVDAPWIGNSEANGARIIQPSNDPNTQDKETVHLKGKTVKTLTQKQANMLWLKGAHYDRSASQLVIDARYGGGCFQHIFALEWDGTSLESFPPQYMFNLVDMSEYDPCKALIDVQLRFDISTMDFRVDEPSRLHIGTPSYGRTLTVELQ